MFLDIEFKQESPGDSLMKSQNTKLLITVIFIGLFASVIWTYLSIKSHPPKEEMPMTTLSVNSEYQIVSGKDLMIWPKGTYFEQGSAAYFYASEPMVTITPIIKIDGLTQGLIQGTLISRVCIQSIDDKSMTYWSYKTKETSLNEFILSDNQSNYQAAGIVLDLPDAFAAATKISEELLFQNGIFQVLIISDITVSGVVNGMPIERIITHSFPINLQQTSFTIPKSEAIVTQVSLTGDAPQSLVNAILELIKKNIIPFVVNFIFIILLLILITINEIHKPKASREHVRFKEWITEGSVEIRDRLIIHIHSLEGLVDLAIDSDKRVIYDTKVNCYYVLTEDIVYLYDIEQSRAILDNKQQLGKLLINQGLIQPEHLEIGLYHHKKIGCRLGESLIALGFIDETTLFSTLASQKSIDYYELNPKKEAIDTNLLKKLTIKQAKAMMAIPLGISSNQNLVIACSEASRAGIKDALQDIFGDKINLVASKPSAIYEILELAERAENERRNNFPPDSMYKGSFESISEEEKKQFITAYYRGNLHQELLLKALGLINSSMLIQIPEKDGLLNWLSGKNLIHADMANLIRGLSRAIKSIDWNDRQERKLPDLLDLLSHSNYITSDTKNWLMREVEIQSLSLIELLQKNFIAAIDTLTDAETILKTLELLVLY
ncbi:MAG: DUF5305 family protein [Mobilitalea sp.]